MRVFYILSGYISHRQAGLDYIACLRELGHEVCSNYPDLALPGAPVETSASRPSQAFLAEPGLLREAERADLVIIHEDAAWYEAFYQGLPGLAQKRVIAYLPWENETLPASFIEPLGKVEGIWTCSEFCRHAFASEFENVAVLPHLVRRQPVGKAALDWGRGMLAERGVRPDETIFFTALDGLNPRKNLEGLLAAFAAFRKISQAPAHLLIKQYRAALPLDGHEGVISLSEMLDDERMAALYALSHAYVSSHHAEGWGLGISTAMAYGKIAIATGYSGNMEFMDESNSIPVPFQMETVSEEMVRKLPLFSTQMRWAAPDLTAMAEAMRRVAEGRVDAEMGRNAAQISKRFGPEATKARLEELLNQLAR